MTTNMKAIHAVKTNLEGDTRHRKKKTTGAMKTNLKATHEMTTNLEVKHAMKANVMATHALGVT